MTSQVVTIALRVYRAGMSRTRDMRCWSCGRFWLLPWACGQCRRARRQMRRDYLRRAAPQDALTDMTRPDRDDGVVL